MERVDIYLQLKTMLMSFRCSNVIKRLKIKRKIFIKKKAVFSFTFYSHLSFRKLLFFVLHCKKYKHI